MEFCAMYFAPQFLQPMGFKLFGDIHEKFLRDMFWDTIKERERSGLKRNDLIDLLVELKNSQGNTEEAKIFELGCASGSLLYRRLLNVIHNVKFCHVRTRTFPQYSKKTSGGNDQRNRERQWRNLIRNGQGSSLEVKELCAKYTTDLIGTTAFGLRVNSLNNPDAEFRKRGREMFTYNLWRSMEISAMFLAPQFMQPMGFKFFTDKHEKFLRDVFWDTIKQRERSGLKRNDLIDLLIDLKNSQDNIGASKIVEFDGDNLVAQAAIFFTGGFETSSTTLSFAMYELAFFPNIQTRLREEIINAIASVGGKISYEMVMSLPYLDMVLSETMRKYPILPFLDRVANADYKVPNSDVVIEKGTPVHIPVLAFHFDPEYFPNPETFDPERFSEENKTNRPPCIYMPFGEGPHICIGMRLAHLQMKLGLIQILSQYELAPCKETMIPLRLNPKAVLTSADGGIYLNVRKISKTTK